MIINKIIIWGHKLHSHTHSYIHYGFYKAFKYLNYNVHWFDDNDNVNNFNFSNSLFITEHQVNNNIPLRDDCLYLSHYNQNNKYVSIPKENVIFLHVSPRDFNECNKSKNYNYELLNYGRKMEYHSFSDEFNRLYIYWATDLLPDEINHNINNIYKTKKENNLYLIGTPSQPWNEMKNICDIKKIQYIRTGATFNINSELNKSTEENMELIQKSIIAPALQDDYQISIKYIPCRIFKNISYGRMGITNNSIVNELFDNKLIYSKDIQELFNKSIEFEKKIDETKDYSKIIELMEIVRDNHTYINRVNTIIKYINNYTNFTFI
jgi:hypothetical protein